MLSDTLVLNDGTDHSYDLVLRSGMESLRREVGVASNLGSGLRISNQVDLAASETKNRHLVQLSWTDVDADDVPVYQGSVHVVISRHKNVTDAKLKLKLKQLADFIADATLVDTVLLGGN